MGQRVKWVESKLVVVLVVVVVLLLLLMAQMEKTWIL
jgi:Tfp pilus assembly protein PilX